MKSRETFVAGGAAARPNTERASKFRSTYRPDIDGLRAIAVLSVIFFHAKYSLFSGGFVGVDVFFVLSGYLITGIIREAEVIDFHFLKQFYERRIRRLLPPAIPVLLVASALGYLLFSLDAMQEYAKSLVSFLFFASNWFFFDISGYFDGPSHLKPLLHTWSLSVEEQFYVLFPISVLLLQRLNKSALPSFIFVVFVISLIHNISLVSTKELNSAFFNSFGRFWEIALGAFLACGSVKAPRSVVITNILGVAGLVAIGFSVIAFKPTSNFPGFLALVPTIGTTFVILAKDSIVSKLLATRPLVAVGLISYAFYLWHWPLFAFLNTAVADPTSLQFAAAILIAFTLSIISYFLLEKPIRYKAAFPKSHHAFFGFLFSISLFLSFGLAGISTNGFQSRFPKSAAEYKTVNEKRVLEFAAAAMRGQCWLAGTEDINIAVARCLNHPIRHYRVLLTGDSHAAQFLSGFRQVFQNIDVGLLAVDACSLSGRPLDTELPTCMGIIRFIDSLRVGDFDAVILVTRAAVQTTPDAAKEYLARVRRLAKITRVYVLGPIQYYQPNMPAIYMNSVGKISEDGIRRMFDSAIQVERSEYDKFLRESLAGVSGVKFISLLDILCPDKRCRHFDNDGWPILVDDSHLSLTGSREVVKQIAGQLSFDAN